MLLHKNKIDLIDTNLLEGCIWNPQTIGNALALYNRLTHKGLWFVLRGIFQLLV